MPHARSRFGAAGEEVAAAYLEKRGYRVIDRNARTGVGEIDLVCRHGCVVVFVEVKTRATHAYGAPEEAVTPAKQRHLVNAAHAYLASHAELRGLPYRIDVVAVTGRAYAEPAVVHIPSAVEATS